MHVMKSIILFIERLTQNIHRFFVTQILHFFGNYKTKQKKKTQTCRPQFTDKRSGATRTKTIQTNRFNLVKLCFFTVLWKKFDGSVLEKGKSL